MAEALAIQTAVAPMRIELHHVGSTAIPGILAKPIIDLLGEVQKLTDVDVWTTSLEVLGYEAMGSYGIDGRRYFRKNSAAGKRTNHLHVFETGSPHLIRHIAFRDYLLAHPVVAHTYSQLKAKIIEGAEGSWDKYLEGKDPFLRRVEADAVDWYKDQKRA